MPLSSCLQPSRISWTAAAPMISVYALTKAAVMMITRSTAFEGGEHGVGAGVVAHGADAPDPAVQRPERRADLDAELLQQLRADPLLLRL